MGLDDGNLGGAIDFPYTVKIDGEEFAVHKRVGDWLVQQKIKQAEQADEIRKLELITAGLTSTWKAACDVNTALQARYDARTSELLAANNVLVEELRALRRTIEERT